MFLQREIKQQHDSEQMKHHLLIPYQALTFPSFIFTACFVARNGNNEGNFSQCSAPAPSITITLSGGNTAGFVSPPTFT
jgi:hypothetical protein